MDSGSTGPTSEFQSLLSRLAEAEDMLRAIRAGEVDAIVVDGNDAPAVYTLKGAAEPYRVLVEQMSEGALTISAEGVILYCNAAFARMLGRPRERLVGALFATLLAGSNHVFQFDRFLARTADGGQELRLRTDGGFDLHVQVSSSRLSIDGEAIYCLVITDLSRQELRVLHEAIVSSSADAIFAIEPDGTIESWNAAAEQLFGYSAEQAIGTNVRTLLPQERQQHADAELRRVGNGEIARFDESCITSTGGAVEMSLILSPIMTPAGSCGAIAVIARDISDRKQAERQVHLLMGEVTHRAKNLLAVVQSIANLTAREGDNKSFVDRLNHRIAALAACHDLLVNSNWQGVDLDDLIRSQLRFYEDQFDIRIFADGPAVRLSAASAQAFGMSLHELSTNAAKYGALSQPSGRVDITWSIGDDTMEFCWVEQGVPPVEAVERRGFGKTVLVQMMQRAVHGSACLEFPPSGCRWKVTAPLVWVIEPGSGRLANDADSAAT